MRHLATIQTIEEILPIDGSDNIEKVRIKNWWCVTRKGEFSLGDKCVYFEIDSLLPSGNPIFSFLASGSKPKTVNFENVEYTGYRLKTIRLRGQISQGLALPTSSFKEINELVVGEDVSEILGIVKYELPIPLELSGIVKGDFPSFIPKTDETRIQNCGNILEKHKDDLFYITEKVDGCSSTFYKKDGVFGVCSRNIELLESEGNVMWKMAKKYSLSDKLPEGFAIQGEIIGNGIQGNNYKMMDQDLFIYNVFDINDTRYLNYADFIEFCENLGLKTVPVLADYSALPKLTVDELLEYADGASVFGNGNILREGIVIRPITEQTEILDSILTRFSFKVVSNKYLLAKGE